MGIYNTGAEISAMLNHKASLSLRFYIHASHSTQSAFLHLEEQPYIHPYFVFHCEKYIQYCGYYLQ